MLHSVVAVTIVSPDVPLRLLHPVWVDVAVAPDVPAEVLREAAAIERRELDVARDNTHVSEVIREFVRLLVQAPCGDRVVRRCRHRERARYMHPLASDAVGRVLDTRHLAVGVAEIAVAVVVAVGLVGVRDGYAVVAGVADAIAVAVGLRGVVVVRAVVVGVVDAIAIAVVAGTGTRGRVLCRVPDRRAVVAVVAHPVAVVVGLGGVRDGGAVIADVADAIAVGVELVVVGVVGAVIDRGDDAVAIVVERVDAGHLVDRDNDAGGVVDIERLGGGEDERRQVQRRDGPPYQVSHAVVEVVHRLAGCR